MLHTQVSERDEVMITDENESQTVDPPEAEDSQLELNISDLHRDILVDIHSAGKSRAHQPPQITSKTPKAMPLQRELDKRSDDSVK